MWTGTTSIRDYISTPIRMCTFVCTLTYKHVFSLARTAKSVSQEWAQGTCKGSRVRNRHIHTHILHPSSKTVLTGLFNRTKPQSLSIYNPPSFFLSLPFFFTLYFIYLRPHLNIDSAPGSSFMVHARVYVCMRMLVCVFANMFDRCESMLWSCVTFPLQDRCACVIVWLHVCSQTVEKSKSK